MLIYHCQHKGKTLLCEYAYITANIMHSNNDIKFKYRQSDRDF